MPSAPGTRPPAPRLRELGGTPPPEPVRLPANTSQQTRQKINSKRTP